MTLENLKKNHARLKWLVSGEFTERDFDYTVKANDNPHGKKGEAGRMTMGDFKNEAGSKRKELIIFKAKETLERFEKNYPEFKEEVQEVVPKVTVNVKTKPSKGVK
ncbi:hypothetical protein LCGC14_2804090 [marine sediment metagenome]|uniref:Uncharacterized protein n=1 Tax=marine sediment metagenome TaxID=412755 RepID=A0A0F8YLY6_9ZZZZ